MRNTTPCTNEMIHPVDEGSEMRLQDMENRHRWTKHSVCPLCLFHGYLCQFLVILEITNTIGQYHQSKEEVVCLVEPFKEELHESAQ